MQNVMDDFFNLKNSFRLARIDNGVECIKSFVAVVERWWKYSILVKSPQRHALRAPVFSCKHIAITARYSGICTFITTCVFHVINSLIIRSVPEIEKDLNIMLQYLHQAEATRPFLHRYDKHLSFLICCSVPENEKNKGNLTKMTCWKVNAVPIVLFAAALRRLLIGFNITFDHILKLRLE
jgi:hypothetical protein